VSSEYRRILAKNAAISGHGYNDAKTGATMSALDGQLATAAGQAVQYATVLMGANDVCTSSPATMTPTATFQAQFQQALSDFSTKDPAAHVFVSSIPNVYQLWSLLHTNFVARLVWAAAGICPSMLSSSNTEKQRQDVLTREKAFNTILAQECGKYPGYCRFDGNRTYNYSFAASEVSTLDYFHPSRSGQAKLATITWAASWWPTL
jgi:lysophospholipase L1-like esterase